MKPEMSIPGQGAQKSGPNTSDPSMDRGTGVGRPHGRPEAAHWLKFDKDRRVTGCQCGFAADVDSDCGWGDSVVEHLFEVAAAAARPVHYRQAAQSLRALLDGLLPIDDRTMGLRYAATRLERTAQDLEDEGDTDA